VAHHPYDMIVIGSGPAGHHAAIQAAKLGKTVAVIEQRSIVGGAAIRAGTLPSKSLREAILYLSGFRQRGLYGISYRVKEDITLSDLRYRVNHVLDHEIEVYRAHFQRNHVELITGTASFASPNTLRVEGDGPVVEVEADNIVIATGSRPAHAPNVPFDGDRIVDTDQLWELQWEKLPRSLTVVGGGVIGMEYACAMAALGIFVTLIERRQEVLDFVDQEVTDALCFHMRSMGTTFRLGEEVISISKTDDGRVAARLKSNKTVLSDSLIYAVGRQGNTDRLNLKAAGLSADERGRISVDGQYRTGVPHIFAVGDVIGFPSLASTSMEQGRLAACAAFGIDAVCLPGLFPYGIYTIPEISYVGKNERELTEDGVPYEVGMARYDEIARGLIIGDESGFLKLLFHTETRQLLGVHILGEGAAELVHIGLMVMANRGTIDSFVNSVFNYPTLAECYKVAALAGMNKLNALRGLAVER
jgi:NAD(P) transhydrogenase